MAGSDTTANTVAFAVYLLSRHGGAEAKMVAEIDTFYERMAKGAAGDEGGRPTFDDLHEFPHVEQVSPASIHVSKEISQERSHSCSCVPVSISARISSIHSSLLILTSCTGVVFNLTAPRHHSTPTPFLPEI